MRRLLTLLMDIIFLALLVGGLVAIWGLRATNSQEDLPATVRVSKGQVSILDPARNSEQKGGGVLSLKAGQTLRVDAGGDAFLFYGDGSVSRLTGPAELRLDESQKTIRKPAILTSLSSKLFNRPPPPPAETKVVVRAQVLRGDVVTKSSASGSKNALFEIRGPAVVVVPTAASFAVNVPEQGDVSVEVGQGQVAVGMVSLQAGNAVTVVVPRLESHKGLTVPPLPADKANSSDIVQMLEKIDAAIPALLTSTGRVTSEGIDFRAVTDAEIPHFIGERLNGRVLVSPPAIVSRNIPNTDVIVESVVVPGTASTSITDKTVADAIPAGFPGDPKVHFLPGGVVQLEYQGMTFVCSLRVVDGRPEISGLPFGVDPPQIEDAVKRALGTQNLPMLLSIVSTEGQATISYATDIVITRTLTVDEQVPVPDSLPHTTQYFSSIPTPREISTDWKVVGSNSLIAILITFLVSVLAKPANSFVGEHEGRVARIYSPLGRGVKAVSKPLGVVGRAISPGPLTRGLWMMFVFGAVYSFLAIGHGLLGPAGLSVLFTLSFTSGFLALYGPWVKSLVAKRLKVDAKVGLFPGQLGIAVVTVGISRLLTFKPGLILGSPGGLRMSDKGLTDRHRFIFDVMSLVSPAVLAVLAAALLFFLPQLSVQSWAAGVFRAARSFFSGLQDWSLVVFVASVQAVFFGLLPRPNSFSWDLMRRHIIIWAIAFAVAAFVFIHTQLNKQRSITDLTPNMYITLAFVAALTVVAYVYRWRKSKAQQKAPEA